MAKPDLHIVDGHAFSWQRLCDLRRQQLEEGKKSEARQPVLFERDRGSEEGSLVTGRRSAKKVWKFGLIPIRGKG
jgi:hypothetical protein